MRFFFAFLGLLLILLQTATSYAWSEYAIVEQFTRMFNSSYVNAVPVWSELVFSLGKVWYGVSALLFVLLAVGTIIKSMKKLIYITFVLSALFLGSMWYAMYPLHIMFGGGINV